MLELGWKLVEVKLHDPRLNVAATERQRQLIDADVVALLKMNGDEQVHALANGGVDALDRLTKEIFFCRRQVFRRRRRRKTCDDAFVKWVRARSLHGVDDFRGFFQHHDLRESFFFSSFDKEKKTIFCHADSKVTRVTFLRSQISDSSHFQTFAHLQPRRFCSPTQFARRFSIFSQVKSSQVKSSHVKSDQVTYF